MHSGFSFLETYMIISAFPGTGKTHFTKNSDLAIDSDSSTFSKDAFPENYLAHLSFHQRNARFIFVSTHDTVRQALIEHRELFESEFLLVYPKASLKAEYIQRYIDRGSPQGFIDLMIKSWDEFLHSCKEQKGFIHVELDAGQTISSILKV